MRFTADTLRTIVNKIMNSLARRPYLAKIDNSSVEFNKQRQGSRDRKILDLYPLVHESRCKLTRPLSIRPACVCTQQRVSFQPS